MNRVYRVDVVPRQSKRDDSYQSDIAALGITSVERVERTAIYFLLGDLTSEQLALLARELLADPVTQQAHWQPATRAVATPPGAARLEVGLLQGVTDSVATNLVARAQLLGVQALVEAASARSYVIYGSANEDELHTLAKRLFYNDVIEYYALGQLTPHLGLPAPQIKLVAESIPLARLRDNELLDLSRDRLLSLDLAEMQTVQAYFQKEGREPTDVELESLAQTWSEHCGHKTFKGIVDYREVTSAGESREEIDSLIRTYLQAATQTIAAPWVRSAFVDNAGILAFTETHDLSFKAETHNHPSALEPFGGANTGIGGVVRDIIGVSARPIANTDVLCFGPLDTELDELPAGVLHPHRIYNGVIGGIEDYGNKMGIPTVNGTIVFEPGYTANPLVYCGCVGIAPVGAHPSGPNPGDLIVVLGGRTGRDGLHGATFSSIELTDETGKTSGGAVQIGNPITEKMVLDAILVARDAQLYSAITDCGAGGLSSAVSEMGEETGIRVQLETVPLKYQGLQPWEIWLSEAQERMVLAVPPENESRVRLICDNFSVEMTVIGTFANDGRLHLDYGAQTVADISMSFLHDGTPRRRLQGLWQEPQHTEPTEALAASPETLRETLLWILAHPNVRSKEDVVRLYDHEVLGGTVVKPFVGTCSDGPSDATLIKPLETGPGWQGFALACGINPAYGEIDPHAMAVSAIDETVRNLVCVGVDPQRIAILDNFCWGNPLIQDRMGSLVRACKGCYDGALQYGTPFVSGKDSLNNEYLDNISGQQVAIPPSLLISGLGMTDDVRKACTMDLKSAGNRLYSLGETLPELGGSYYYRKYGWVGSSVPRAAEHGPAIANTIHAAIQSGLVAACHDCSEGGLAVAITEMAFAGDLGATISLGAMPNRSDAPVRNDWLLFSESNGRYIVEVSPQHATAFELLLEDLPWGRIGEVTAEKLLTVIDCEQDTLLLQIPLADAKRAWQTTLKTNGERA